MKITSSNKSLIRSRLLARASLVGLASVSGFLRAQHSETSQPAHSVSRSVSADEYSPESDKEANRIKSKVFSIGKTDDETREESEIGLVSSLEIYAETFAQSHSVGEIASLLLPSEKRRLAQEVLVYRIKKDLTQFDASKARNSWLVIV